MINKSLRRPSMDRIPPTEPPDEPVNRIAPFLEKLEAARGGPWPLSALGEAGTGGTLEEQTHFMQEWTREFLRSHTADVWAHCLAIPGFWSQYKTMLRLLLQRDTPFPWHQCLLMAEEPKKHLPAPDPELNDIIAEAKRKLAESGEG